MRFVSQVGIVGLAILVALTAGASVATPHFSPAPTKPAGCHEQGVPMQSPAPVSYACCQSGHDRAIISSSIPYAPALHVVGVVREDAPLAMTGFASSAEWYVVSGDPPGVLVLRI